MKVFIRFPGFIALLIIAISSTAGARAKPTQTKKKNKSQLRKRRGESLTSFASPDQRHVARLTTEGRLNLDGNNVLSGTGRTIGQPTWRHDSRALAFLQMTPHGRQLVVLIGLDTRQPLIWNLPMQADAMDKIFWISEKRVGVGARELVPRLVVSWSTSTIHDS